MIVVPRSKCGAESVGNGRAIGSPEGEACLVGRRAGAEPG